MIPIRPLNHTFAPDRAQHKVSQNTSDCLQTPHRIVLMPTAV